MKRYLIVALVMALFAIATPADASMKSSLAKIGHGTKAVLTEIAHVTLTVLYCIGAFGRCT